MVRGRTRSKKNKQTEELLIPSGVTLLNCALSDRWDGGYRPGKVYNKIGDSFAGKTIEAMTMFAQVANDKRFNDFDLIMDQAEYGEGFNREKLFGKKLVARLKAPRYKGKKKVPVYSDTVQDFHMHVVDAIERGKPFIYCLDSFDSADEESDKKHLAGVRKSWKAGKEKEGGTYGMGKAKQASAILRNIKGGLEHTNSFLMVISQTRANINAGLFGDPRTRSGGKALKFYSWQEQWMLLGKKITKGKDKTQIGVNTISRFGKNRETGKLRKVTYPIYTELGIDDLGGNINYLKDRKWIKKSKGDIIFPALDIEADNIADLIEYIEDNNLERRVQRIVGDCWTAFEDGLKMNRKLRFT